MFKIKSFIDYITKCKGELKNIKFTTKKELYPRTVGVVAVAGVVSVAFVLLDLIIKSVLFLFY